MPEHLMRAAGGHRTESRAGPRRQLNTEPGFRPPLCGASAGPGGLDRQRSGGVMRFISTYTRHHRLRRSGALALAPNVFRFAARESAGAL